MTKYFKQSLAVMIVFLLLITCVIVNRQVVLNKNTSASSKTVNEHISDRNEGPIEEQSSTITDQLDEEQYSDETNQSMEEQKKGNDSMNQIYRKVAYANMNLKRPLELYGLNFQTIVSSKKSWQLITQSLPDFSNDYNDAFFKEFALIVFIMHRGVSGATLQDLTVFNDDGNILVEIYANNGMLDSSTEWAVVIEVKKTDLRDAKKLCLKTDFYSHFYLDSNLYDSDSYFDLYE